MLAFLRYLDARFGEASTYAAIAAMLTAAHVSVDPGLLHTVTLWGVVISGAAAVLLKDWGSKPPGMIATDVLAALVSGIKAMPDAAQPTVSTTTTTTPHATGVTIVTPAPAPATTAPTT